MTHPPPPAAPVAVRAYAAGDGPATLAVFLDAVTITAAEHYSPEQIAAWSAPEERDVDAWDRERVPRVTVVAVLDGHIAGFSDVSAEGYIHMMFVSPRFARRGVAGALLSEDERRARALGAGTLTTNAGITARPFFERYGFVVVTEQHPVTRGVRMTNYRMLKRLS
jgi:putative acetyltransferase